MNSTRTLLAGAALAAALVLPHAAAAQDTIKVGVLHSLSGTMAISETTLKDTILMMVDAQNKKGGLLGKKLEAVVVDPASDWPLFAEKARELLEKDKVAVVFGCWTSVSRKSVLPVFEKDNGLLFYPVQYEGEESSKNVIYTGAAPNQQAIPAVDYLMKDVGVKRWVLEGTDYVYPRTTNKILEAYLRAKGVAAADISINYTPFGHADWQTRVAAIKQFGSAGKKTAVVSTINGDANVPFYKELGNQKISAEDIPVVAFSVGEEELSGLDTKPLVGHLAAWNYFESINAPANKAFIDQWKAYIKKPNRTTNDPMEAHFIGFNLWVKAVEKAKSTEVDKVLAALPGLETPNLTGGVAKMLPNHHITKPVYIGEVRADGQFDVVWKTEGTVPGDAWSDYLPGSMDTDADWVGLKCGNYNKKTKVCSGQMKLQMRRRTAGGRWPLGLLLAASVLTRPVLAQPPEAAFAAALGELREASFADKETLANRLIETGHPAARPVLTAWLEDRLYFRQSDQQIVIVKVADESAASVALVDPLSGRDAGSAARDELTKIGTNNRLRRVLRTTIARFALSSPDTAVRLEAVKDLVKSLDEANTELLLQRRDAETDSRVRAEIETGLALSALEGTDPKARLDAVEALKNRLRPEVRNRLARLLEKGPDGSFIEGDEAVRQAAALAVRGIDHSRTLYSAIETLFFGLSLGSVLVLVAIGLAITFGVMGVINMAHGELMMLGAYTTYVVQLAMPQHIGASILVAIPMAFLVAGVTGIALERTIIRFLYGRPLETLLATFGVSLILQQLVRSVFSANNRSVETPAWMSGTLQFNEALALTLNRLYIVGFTLILFAILVLVMRRTRLGLDIRAVAQNRAMARAMGIRSEWVDAMTFGLGSGIAGVAGVALSQLTNVGPNLGQAYIIDSFMVVVFGGVGNLWGTLIGGMSIGVVNKLLEPYSGAVLGKIFVLVALILFIQRRPRGLFPQTGRAAESQ